VPYGASMPASNEIVEVAGREVTITNPGKVFYPRTGHTKMDMVRYYLAVADGAIRGVSARPMALKRFVNGAEGEAFFQKRAPESRPDWIETVELRFPSGRTASEVVVRDAAQLVWVVNLGCIDLNPHPVRADDLDHPDELRIDLDPVRGVPWSQVREVAMVAREVLTDFGLTGWPKTSGSRGMHIYCRIERRWPFAEVRRAAVAFAREVERRAPTIATSKWWKEERHGVFLDYNQNAKDRTIASAYSLRPLPDARASTPLSWDEVPDCEPEAFTIETVPARYAEIGDPAAAMDESGGSLAALLELADRHEAEGLPDAPWPPHYEKQAGEAPRVQPSKRRRDGEVPPPAPGKTAGPTGRRRTTVPMVEIARAASDAEALAGLERWKARHPEVVPHLAPNDVLVDAMRGASSTWTRIRVNLTLVPEEQRPKQEPLEVDYDPWVGYRGPLPGPGWRGRGSRSPGSGPAR
jgi:bifunctional non-homologous end joining protein LigD